MDMNGHAPEKSQFGYTIAELQRLHAASFRGPGDGVSDKAARSYLTERAGTIYGGTSEIQKTIIWRGLAG